MTNKQDGNYLDGHCAGFNGWQYEQRDDYAACQYDRGY
jgi:hypothetical protein